MGRRIVTNEAELRRIALYAKSRFRNLDDLYRAIVRVAAVDLDDLRRILSTA